MREPDHIYFARRALEERDAAERVSSEPARRSHTEIAERYARVAQALEAAGGQDEGGVDWAIVSRISIDAEREAASARPEADAAEP